MHFMRKRCAGMAYIRNCHRCLPIWSIPISSIPTLSISLSHTPFSHVLLLIWVFNYNSEIRFINTLEHTYSSPVFHSAREDVMFSEAVIKSANLQYHLPQCHKPQHITVQIISATCCIHSITFPVLMPEILVATE